MMEATAIPKVAFGEKFLTSFIQLPKQEQRHVQAFLIKFRANPASSAIHYEKIASEIDDKVWSVRINDTYRGIVVRDNQGVYVLLWVDHHDEAYAWARRKSCKVNPYTGAIQVYTVQEEVETVTAPGLFQSISDSDMLRLGVPEEQMPLIRSFISKEDLKKFQSDLSPDVYESLFWLSEGIPFSEVLDYSHSEKERHSSENLRDALETSSNQRFFHVVEGEEEMRNILEWPLDKWRVFLHPTQRAAVTKDYSGSARVMGGAGTGKTVVAMHRAKRLAGKLSGRDKLLFTTYTANLATDIQENLKKICTTEELSHIDVINLDAWVARYMRNEGYGAMVQYQQKELDKVWEDAIAGALADELGLPASFYMEEWDRVVIPQHAMTAPLYARCSRNGRGTSLDRRKRAAVWKVFEAYQQEMRKRGWRDIQWAMDECAVLLQKENRTLYPYIIVDEGQDFSPAAMKLIRSIAGEEHPNDIFIVGDSHQRIYRNKTVLKQCGIRIQGRSSILHINYRTTEETRAFAMAVLKGIAFDDLDGDTLTKDACQSLTHGSNPTVQNFRTANEEIDFIVDKIGEMQKAGVPLQDICITARTHNMLDNYLHALTDRGFRCYELKKDDDRALPGIRFATMHRVKGLEFRYIFVAGANENVIPLKAVVSVSDPMAKKEADTSERCLLYVALTRAREAAYVTSYGKQSHYLQ